MKTKLIITFAILFAGLQLSAQITLPEPLVGYSLTKEYITQNLVYPEADLNQGNSGTVVVTFHLDTEGNASQHAVKSSFSEAASLIAMHLVKTILWKPALNIGLPIEYDYEYKVDFNAKSYKRYWKRHERPVVPLTLEADTSYMIYEYKQLNEVAKPYFADGNNMGKYIAYNLKYPEAAKEREIQGTVRLSFVVETNGNVSNIVVVNSVGGGCDNEAIRLIQETVWIPAEKNGKYVRSYNMQDITFSIGNRNFLDGNNY
jgi:TonB family protein